MTLEEAIERIADLEAENARLVGERRTWRNLLPKGAEKVAPSLFRMVGSNLRTIKGDEMNQIGHIIRALCFPTTKKRRKTRGGNTVNADCSIRLLDMTDEQYEKYSAAMLDVLRTIEKHRSTSMEIDHDGSN